MDVKGSQDQARLLKERIARPQLRVLSNSVSFLFEARNDNDTYRVLARGTVDRTGHVEIDTPAPYGAGSLDEYQGRQHTRRQEYTDTLIDNGLAEWRRVSEEDSELYATEALMDRFWPALRALPDGWQEWSA